MAVVAIADWTLMYEDQAGTLRGYQRSMFGGAPDEKPEAHRKASPITYAAEYRRRPSWCCKAKTTRAARPAKCASTSSGSRNSASPIEVHWFDAGPWLAGRSEEQNQGSRR